MVARIAPPPAIDPAAASPEPAGVTGELATLWRWWATVSDGAAPIVRPVVARPEPGSGDGALEAMAAGMAAAEAAADSGATLLVPRVDPRDQRAARIIIALLTRAEPAAVLSQPAGVTDRAWVAECTALRDGLTAVRDLRSEPLQLMDALGASGVASVVGVLLGAAARRTGCLVDGTDEAAAALLADRIAFRAKDWWRAGSTSPDPARTAAFDRIDLPAGLPLGLTDEDQRGARATIAVLEGLVSD